MADAHTLQLPHSRRIKNRENGDILEPRPQHPLKHGGCVHRATGTAIVVVIEKDYLFVGLL